MAQQDSETGPLKHGLIAVIPLGNVGDDVLRVVADSLQGILRVTVDLLDPEPLPPQSFMEARNQYNAMAIIKHLSNNHAQKTLKVLGVTKKDLGNPILTHVFGEAYMGGPAAVMSGFRLCLGPNAEFVPRNVFLDRVAKVALHEIGHTFNLPHCHAGCCVMRASNTLAELDDKLNYLCDYCEKYLFEAVRNALTTPKAEEHN